MMWLPTSRKRLVFQVRDCVCGSQTEERQQSGLHFLMLMLPEDLTSEFRYSKGHWDLNIQRIDFVTDEITNNLGIAICGYIASHDAVRMGFEILWGKKKIFRSCVNPLRGMWQRDRIQLCSFLK